jgi:hypothetical protein
MAVLALPPMAACPRNARHAASGATRQPFGPCWLCGPRPPNPQSRGTPRMRLAARDAAAVKEMATKLPATVGQVDTYGHQLHRAGPLGPYPVNLRPAVPATRQGS